MPPDDPLAAAFEREGVTCDFCHTVESVSLGARFPLFHTSPGVMHGPSGGESGKTIHKTKFSVLQVTSELCAGCHEYKNGFGVPILGTYSEWAGSFYRGQSIHCQFCHLPQIFDAKLIAASEKGPLDHSMSLGNSRERLAKAILMRADLKVSGKNANLLVSLKNDMVGHKTPSGIPTSRLRLVSTLMDASGNILGKKEETFEKVVGDGTGKPVTQPELIFTAAPEVLKDNRLGPKETRRIVQVFSIDGPSPASAELALFYEEPLKDRSSRTRIFDLPVIRIVAPARMGISRLYAISAALAAVFILLAVMVCIRRRG